MPIASSLSDDCFAAKQDAFHPPLQTIWPHVRSAERTFGAFIMNKTTLGSVALICLLSAASLTSTASARPHSATGAGAANAAAAEQRTFTYNCKIRRPNQEDEIVRVQALFLVTAYKIASTMAGANGHVVECWR